MRPRLTNPDGSLQMGIDDHPMSNDIFSPSVRDARHRASAHEERSSAVYRKSESGLAKLKTIVELKGSAVPNVNINDNISEDSELNEQASSLETDGDQRTSNSQRNQDD